MLTVFDMLKTAALNHARYRRMRDEIANLPETTAMDVGLFPADAERIAYKAVYGKAA